MSRACVAFATAAATAWLLAACAGTPAGQAPARPAHASPAEMLAAIRTAAGDGERELAVQPLRDPAIEDLRQKAAQLEAQGKHDEAAAVLDRALAIVADDPAVLQERAEIAILQQDFALAARLAERGYALGAQLGPLCRRHWATLEQVRLAEGDAAGAQSARVQIEGCRVAPPARY